MIPLLISLRPSAAVGCRSAAGPRFARGTSVAVLGLLAAVAPVTAQVITIDTKANGPVATAAGAPVDRRFAQITPTNVPLSKAPLDSRTKLALIRAMQAEQGFAMRPIPRGHKGLTLKANGKLEPAGEAYLNMTIASGTSAKPGERLVITDVKIDKGKIVFALNGGPDFKHRFLRHVELGAGDPNYTNPVVQDNEQDPAGARVTLDFDGRIPELTAAQVKALLAPLISFDVKTPVQAFTDTLPPVLKDAILGHHVMVGMSTDMVLFAKGRPRTKTREMDGQMPFEEWIYGTPPDEVDFVRINGNRVIRLEIAKAGEPPEIFTKDVVSDLLRTDGTPAVVAANHVHVEKEGDVQHDPDREAAPAPPSLRQPGDPLPVDQQGKNGRVGVMRPVQFPKEKQPGSNPDSVPDDQTTNSGQSTSQPATSGSSGTSSAQPVPVKPPSPAQGTDQPN